MPPIVIAGAIAAGGAVAGGLLGKSASDDANEAAQAKFQRAYDEFSKLGIPPIEAQKLALQIPELQGKLRPELEQFIATPTSKLEEISTDPRLKAAQMGALEKLSSLGSAKLTPEEEAQLSKIKRGVAREAQGRQESILQGMAQRGMGGSGAELAAQLSASQAGAERAAQEGEDVRAQASKRALEAIMQSGALGGQIRGQDFGEQAQKAQATDAINRFNTELAVGRQSRNVGALNEAQARNLAEQQRVHELGAQMRNYQQQYNKELIPKQFQQQVQLAAGKSGQLNQMGNADIQHGQQTAAAWGGMGQGIAQAAGGVAAGYAKKWTGGQVPGEAKYDGDHPDNDTIKAKLSPGEIVIPRSFAMDPATAKKYIDRLALDKWRNKKD